MKNFKQMGWVIFALLCLGFSQPDTWELKKDKDGIQVYTRPVEGIEMDAFKGTAVLQAPRQRILAVLKDGNGYTRWSPDCAVSLQKENTPTRQVNYTVTDAPFPVTDRDSYVELTFTTQGQSTKITLKGLPDYAPQDPDYMRIPFIEGYWLLEEISANQTRVTYELQAHPGGSIPTWLANATAVDQPFKSIEGLREMVE